VGIRLLVVDDNPHVRWRGRVYPVDATFDRFLPAFLDLPGSPIASITHAVPVRDLPDDGPEPATATVDHRIATVPTAPFEGIAGYLRRLPAMLRANRRILRAAVRDADLVWIKVPASNAGLAAVLARRAGVERFIWVAGSAREVAAARFHGVRRAAGMLVGASYDAIGRLAGKGGLRVAVGHGLVDGDGVVPSLIGPDEIRRPDGPWPLQPGKIRLVWAGRVAQGKGLETVIDALPAMPTSTELSVLGDGPAMVGLAARASALGVAQRVAWLGYIGERQHYLDCVAAADLFVFPSPAEGFPKVILDAMAVGLPVVASPSGSMSELVAARLVESVPAGDPRLLAAAVRNLLEAPNRALELRSAGAAFAGAHTRPLEAAKLVRLWRTALPGLPWD
jgi:glycosyltransferase involved in cell wall biosynthesis